MRFRRTTLVPTPQAVLFNKVRPCDPAKHLSGPKKSDPAQSRVKELETYPSKSTKILAGRFNLHQEFHLFPTERRKIERRAGSAEQSRRLRSVARARREAAAIAALR